MQISSGIFHPKAYFFEFTNAKWECIMGSSNFTQTAFEQNDEMAILVDQDDLQAEREQKKFKKVFNNYWKFGSEIDDVFLKSYSAIWRKNQKRVKSLSGKYGKKEHKKGHKYTDPFLKCEISTLEWSEFVERVQSEDEHNLDGRLHVLESIRDFFKSDGQLHNMNLITRQKIAGLIEEEGVDWKWFGSMTGSGDFKKLIYSNSPNLSSALDCIPIDGEIYKEQYQQYIQSYIKVFPAPKNYLATATRLLAMKRPDQFICLDNANMKQFCLDFSIPQSLPDVWNYWDEIIERIHECVWWNSPPPSDPTEKKIWNSRTALLDALYYVPSRET